MTVGTDMRPRVLVVGDDATWRQRLRDHVGGLLGTGEAASVEEALTWLEGRAPGVTVLGVAAADPLAEESVARIHELHGAEIVVLATTKPTLDLCRRAMRAGAFDVIARSACLGPELEVTLAAASARIAAAQAQRRRRTDRVREAVSRHERRAAANLLENHAVSSAWSRLDPELRRAWIGRYLAAAADDAAERATFVRQICDEIGDAEQPAAVAIALHVQALTSVQAHPGSEAPAGCRNLCLEVLAALVERARASSGTARAGEWALWHRWRLDGEELWWLVIDGQLRAQVRVTASGVDGHWLGQPGATQIRSSQLPQLPEALREIERRVGCGYVMDVAPAEDI